MPPIPTAREHHDTRHRSARGLPAVFLSALALAACKSNDGASAGSQDASTTRSTGGASGGGQPGDGGRATGAADASDGRVVPPAEAGCRAPEPHPSPGNDCHDAPPPPLTLTEVARGFDVPVFLTHAPGDAERLFVVERGGRIRIIRDGTVEPEPFLDISDLVVTSTRTGDERGLLGLAFDPDYQRSGRFWVNYTGRQGNADTVIASYRGTPGQPADPGSASTLLTVEQMAGNHNGGMIAFGADGCLYIGMGDGGGANDPGNHGQRPQTQLGSMLRVDVDGYPDPAPGNMAGSNVDPHTWAYGLRNPWRFSFDRATGDLYIGDVGQGAWEEINVEPAGVGHRNYGWNIMEGTHCLPPLTTCDRSGKTLPVAEHENPPHRAIIGGYVYRGAAIPELVGRYLYGDYRSRTLWTFTWTGEADGVGEICDQHELPIRPDGDINSFGEDENGELYIVTMPGVIYRLEPA